MKIFYLIIASLFIGFISFALPYDIKIDSTGLAIVEKKPLENRRCRLATSPEPLIAAEAGSRFLTNIFLR